MTRALSGRSAGLPVQRASGAPYPPGTYGRRKDEKEFLQKAHGVSISGDKFQVEHGHGHASTARNAPVPRRRNRRHEGEIFAYHEELKAHRAHPGTGTSLKVRSTGLNSKTYRDRQEEYLVADKPFRSLETNLLEYNTLDEFHNATGTPEAQVADASYLRSLKGNPRTPFYDSQGNRHYARSLLAGEQARLHIGRVSMREGRELPHDERVQILREVYGGTRFDEYPTRSHGMADGDELTHFFDEPRKKRSRQYKKLKRLARTPYKPGRERDRDRRRRS